MKIGIIGGGASGVVLALKLKLDNPNIDITIFEAENKLLSKVMASGGGKGNIGNNRIDPCCFNNPTFIREFQSEIGDEYLAFFASLGLLTRENEGRIYPYSESSNSFAGLLIDKLKQTKVKVLKNYVVKSVSYDERYIINDEYIVDLLVVASGSPASYPKYDGAFLNSFGLKKKEFTPALVGLKVIEDVKPLSGLRIKGKVSYGDKFSVGEINFKDQGLSGICVMDLSRDVLNSLGGELVIDFFPDFTSSALVEHIQDLLETDKKLNLHSVFTGTLPEKLLSYMHNRMGKDLPVRINDEVLMSYVQMYKGFRLTPKVSYGMSFAQVASGGVEVRKDFQYEERLYVIGEALDIDGICGGYNLWFAFSSALHVARLIKKMPEVAFSVLK